ncbi:XRE family transcriptional regulator [Micrococcus luteus]|uniref:XRE family transcriptional regulator n=1 Tax=Micrococcus luteus TaxID=1270 RepID=UPI003019AF06
MKATVRTVSLNSDALRGDRLLTLRHMEGVTQAELAKSLGVGQAFISRVERGDKPMPEDLAVAAANQYKLPVEFFAQAPSVTDLGVPTFRKKSTASVRDEQKILSIFGEAARLFYVSSEHSGYLKFDVDDAVDDDVEETASNLRSILGLDPDDPLLNATRAAERLGVGVIHDLIPGFGDGGSHHGVSRPCSAVDRPLIATVSHQPPAVARMTMMHELGHVVYDRGDSSMGRGVRAPEETRAFRFAGAMLIPASVIRKRVTESLTLNGYLAIKADYGVSVSALVKRAEDLHVISKARARSLFIQISSQGWRYNEPVPVAAERSLLVSQAAERAFDADGDLAARTVGVALRHVEHWTELESRKTETPLAEVIQLRSFG